MGKITQFGKVGSPYNIKCDCGCDDWSWLPSGRFGCSDCGHVRDDMESWPIKKMQDKAEILTLKARNS